MRRLSACAAALGMLVPAMAVADELSTKERIIERSAPICREMIEASAPHLERADEASEKDQVERFIRESRLALDAVRRVDPDLKDLVPPTGARQYRRFVRNGRTALDQFDAALDALEAGRTKGAMRHRVAALEHLQRAKRAARRYGLHRPCIRLVS